MVVYSYMRFSDPRQASGSSAARQDAYARRWAAEHGMALDESLTLRDEGLSAFHERHVKSGALGVFLEAVQSGRIVPGSVLVVEGLDRLSRAEPILAQAQLAQIVNAGVSVVTASDNKLYSRESLRAQPMDLVYSLLVMIRAHEESATKSTRVTAAIRRQCEGWLAGTWRGVIRQGKDPLWLRLVQGQWEEIPERVAAVRRGLELYRSGRSATRILKRLTAEGLSLSDRGPQALQIYRLIKQRALLGERELEVGGKAYVLPGYYPALLTQAEWDDLQALSGDRGRRPGRGVVPHIITGLGITVCGYCGRAMVGQNLRRPHRSPDQPLTDGHRRLHCTSVARDGCPVAGSISVAPVERLIMRYCADQMNLAMLYGADRTSGPRAKLTAARDALAKMDAQIEKLTTAMLESDDAPAAWAKRARDLEAARPAALADVKAAERELAAVSRVDTTGRDAVWAALVDGVEAQDTEARLQARQLVADTFDRIVVYHRGIRPKEIRGRTQRIDLVLMVKGGISRLLTGDRSGRLISSEDFDLSAID